MQNLTDDQDYFSMSLDDVFTAQQSINPEQKFLNLFQRTAKEVPAYQDFLQDNQIQASNILGFQDFQNLPMINKANYVQAYPLAERCFGGSLAGADRVAVSSGSTGQPSFWPRSTRDEQDVAMRFEQIFVDSFHLPIRSTLAVVCFAMGNWVGGLYTTSCCWHLARKGYRLLTATPGNNKAEIFRIIRELAPQFDQTVLLGYPPFIKDVIEAGLVEGIDWSEFHTKLVFAGEVFSEEWREALTLRIGSGNILFDSASMYGTADGGVLGNETPLSIAIRRWLAAHPALAHELFGESRLPTLVQYDPVSRFFEAWQKTLLFSAENSAPLIRYHIADSGGIIRFHEMQAFLRANGVASYSVLGLPADFQARNLPFVFVFGRSDFTISYYGANIYPENIAVGLEQPDIIRWVTGKFVLELKQDPAGDHSLEIAVELLPEIEEQVDMAVQIAHSIQQQLLRLNSEFANYIPVNRQLPNISLYKFADPLYFPTGVKHRYTRKPA
jgi:phenylacetate-CoA ligase